MHVAHRHDVPLPRVEDRPPGVGRGAQLDDAVPVVEAVGHVQHDRLTVAHRVDLAVDGRRGVDDEDVAGVQVVGQVAEADVVDAVGRADQQPHLVARQAALLGRARGEGGGGEAGARGLVEEGHHRSSARYRPDPGRASSRVSSRGTTVSGSGRSEMSSPGKASWCIAVRMSPGSTA